jgi:hypothetical protein
MEGGEHEGMWSHHSERKRFVYAVVYERMSHEKIYEAL